MIGENIQKLRKLRGLSVKQIASRIGVSEVTYYKYEEDEREISIDTAQKLAEVFDVTIDYLCYMGQNRCDYTLDQTSTRILKYLSTEWDGDYNSMIQLLGTYASMPIEMRKDVAEHCICMFVNGLPECNQELVSHINVPKCQQIVARMQKKKSHST